MEPHEELVYFSRPSLCLTSHDIDYVNKHCEVLAEFLRLRAYRFVSARADEPLLEQFLSDGTPYTTTHHNIFNWDEWKQRREGRECKDFLVQRLFLVDVHQNVVPYFKEPGL